MGEAEPPGVVGLDATSFEEFVAGSSARLFTMARLLTGGHRAEAEDLLQGAYERAYRRWGRISRRADPERYVRQILVNASVNRWRRLRRHPETSLLVTGADRGAADTAAAVADRDLLLRGLASLPPGSGPCWCCGTSRTCPRPRRRRCSAAAWARSRARPRAAWPGCAAVPVRQAAGTPVPGKARCAMTDFESRLRAAMAAAAGPPPAGLLAGIRRRHRRHVRRVAAACVALVAAAGIAAPLVARGLLAGPAGTGPGTGPAGTGPAVPAATSPAIIPSAVPTGTATAAPGTVLRDCQSNNNGTVGSTWKRYSVHAGPVWFIYERPRSTPRRPAAHRREAGLFRHGHRGPQRPHGRGDDHPRGWRALPVPRQVQPHGVPYTLAEGAPGLTLAGCPAGPAGTNIPPGYAPGLTMFWEGFVTDLRGCIALEVRTSPGRPVRVTVANPSGGCR